MDDAGNWNSSTFRAPLEPNPLKLYKQAGGISYSFTFWEYVCDCKLAFEIIIHSYISLMLGVINSFL